MAKNSPVSTEAQRVAKLTAERGKLREREAQLERDVSDIEQGIVNEHSIGALDRAAADLREHGVSSLDDGSVLGEQLNTVLSQLRVVKRALQMNARELIQAEAAVKVQATESTKPEYVSIVREIKDKIAALQSALAKEAGFHYRLDQIGGSFGCGVLYNMAIDAGQFDGWLADAAAYYGV